MTRLLSTLAGAALLTVATGSGAQEARDICAEHHTEGSVEACQQAVETNPDDPKAHRRLAISLTFIGAYQRAIEAQNQVIALEPDSPRAHYELAVILGFIQEYPQAVEPIETALELDPENPEYWSAAELILLNAGFVDRAVEAARMGAALGDRTAMYNLAWHLHDGKGSLESDVDEAFKWMERAAERGHMGALSEMVTIFLEGGFGKQPDDNRAELWAERRRAERKQL